MTTKSKLRDSVVGALRDLSADLDILVRKSEDSDSYQTVKEKVCLIKRKLELVSEAVVNGNVRNRDFPEILDLAELFEIDELGGLKTTGDFEDILDLVKTVSCKVASVFELACFKDWNLVPENRNSVPPISASSSKENLEPLPAYEPVKSEAVPEKPACSKAAKFVQVAKKPVVLFNPAMAKKTKEESVPANNHGSESVSSASLVLPSPSRGSNDPVFSFSNASLHQAQPVQPQVANSAKVAEELIMKAMQASAPSMPSPMVAPIQLPLNAGFFPQPLLPESLPHNPFNQFMPPPFLIPNAPAFLSGPPVMKPNSNFTMPASPPQILPAKKKPSKIVITDPQTGEVMDYSHAKEADVKASPCKPQTEIVNPPSNFTDFDAFGSNRSQTSLDDRLADRESVSSRPSSAMPSAVIKPPGFEFAEKKKNFHGEETEPEPPKIDESEDIVNFASDFLRQKTKKTGKVVKVAKVFSEYQQKTKSIVDQAEFISTLKANSAFFRFSASGSKIELVEVIELKIIQFIVAELVRSPGGSNCQTLFDAYIAAMRDSKRVIHVGSKFSYDNFTDIFANRAVDVVEIVGDFQWRLADSVKADVCSIAKESLLKETDVRPLDLHAKFLAGCSSRLAFFITESTFVEILTQHPDQFHIANSRVNLTTNPFAPFHNSLTSRQLSGGLGGMDDYGEPEDNSENRIEHQIAPSGDLTCRLVELLPKDDGNYDEISQFADEFNETIVDSPDVIPVRPLPDVRVTNARVGFFEGQVSYVSMESRRVFIEFRKDPVGAGYSQASDLRNDEDFGAYANAIIHGGGTRLTPPGWCDIGKPVLYYDENADHFGRGIVMNFTALPRCDIDIRTNVVESLTILDIDTGIVLENVRATHASALNCYKDIPCLVVRCSFVLEPGAIPPKLRRNVQFTLDLRSLYPPTNPKEKPAKAIAVHKARILDYRSGVLPLPVVILAP